MLKSRISHVKNGHYCLESYNVEMEHLTEKPGEIAKKLMGHLNGQKRLFLWTCKTSTSNLLNDTLHLNLNRVQKFSRILKLLSEKKL